jgi:integrase
LSRAKPHLALAVALGAYSGMRLADVLSVPWSAYDGQNLEFRQAKTGDPIWLPVHRTLKEILDHSPRVSTIIVTGEQRRPYTRDGFSATFRRFIASLRDEGLVGKGLTFHGLRHTIATRLADAGADLETIAAVTGHRSTAMVRHYTKTANTRKRAQRGIRLLEQNEA